MIHNSVVQKCDLVHASPVLLWWFKAKRGYDGVQRHDLQREDEHRHRLLRFASTLAGQQNEGEAVWNLGYIFFFLSPPRM